VKLKFAGANHVVAILPVPPDTSKARGSPVVPAQVYAAPLGLPNVAYAGRLAATLGISSPSAPYIPCQLPSVVVSTGGTNVTDVPAVPDPGGFKWTVAVPVTNPSAGVAEIVMVVATETVTGAV
jgi:hypothetical protein